jgi:hypothetical protein
MIKNVKFLNFIDKYKYLLLIGFVIYIWIMSVGTSQTSHEKNDPRKELISEHFSSWDGSHIELTKLIKQGMNDPDSYEHVETKYIDKSDYLLVSTTFRGKNLFGGLVKNTVTAKVDLIGNVIEVIE